MERIEAIVPLAVALSPGNLNRLRELLPDIVPEPVPMAVAYEILLQSHLFFGFAQAIEAAKVFAEVLPKEQQSGVCTPPETADLTEMKRRGQALCRQVYAPNFDRLVADLRDASPELAEWMVVDGYGKVLSRPGPTALEREFASIVFLAISGHQVQLYSHVRAARNLGATPESILRRLNYGGLSNEQIDFVKDRVARVYGS